MSFNNIRRFGVRYTIIFLIPIVLLFTGCGTDIDSPTGEIIAPPGSMIVINPESYEIKDGSLLPLPHYTTFSISVINPEGQPIGKVRLKISYQWATPDISGVVQLYDGFCSDNYPPTNPPKNSPMDAVTDDYGVYYLCVGYQSGGGLEYYADIQVYSGTVYGSAELKVTVP